MTRGSKKNIPKKAEEQAEHIEQSYESAKARKPEEGSGARAWATVNKHPVVGNRRGLCRKSLRSQASRRWLCERAAASRKGVPRRPR